MDSLPVETFSTILRMAIEGETRSSRYSTLRACSLVCSGWHDIAQVELWRRVEVLGSTWTAFMSTLLSGEKPKPVLKDLRLSEMSSGQVVSIFSIVKGIEKLVLDRVVGFDAAMFALPMLADLKDLDFKATPIEVDSELAPSFRLQSLKWREHRDRGFTIGTLPTTLLINSVSTLTSLELPIRSEHHPEVVFALAVVAANLTSLSIGRHTLNGDFANAVKLMTSLRRLSYAGRVNSLAEMLSILPSQLHYLEVQHVETTFGRLPARPDFAPLLPALDAPSLADLKRLTLIFKDEHKKQVWYHLINVQCTKRGIQMWRRGTREW